MSDKTVYVRDTEAARVYAQLAELGIPMLYAHRHLMFEQLPKLRELMATDSRIGAFIKASILYGIDHSDQLLLWAQSLNEYERRPRRRA